VERHHLQLSRIVGQRGHLPFAQNPQDLRAVLAFLRDPAHAGPLGIDTRHLAVVGHSMGGWVTAMGADSDLAGLVLISAADFGMLGRMEHTPLVKFMSENMETLAGTSPEALADELNAHPADYDYAARGPALVGTPLLVLTSNDGLAPHGKALVEAVRKAGGKRVQTAHVATDHSWSDRRIELEARVITFLSPLLR
jgi:acetyl esterase/lipase